MFDALSDRFDGIFKRLRGRGRLGEAEVDEVLREIRLALLEADVNFKVVRGMLDRIRERAIGADRPLPHAVANGADHLEVDVGLEQGDPYLAQDLVDIRVGEAALAAETLEDAVEAVGECVEHEGWMLPATAGSPATRAQSHIGWSVP